MQAGVGMVLAQVLQLVRRSVGEGPGIITTAIVAVPYIL